MAPSSGLRSAGTVEQQRAEKVPSLSAGLPLGGQSSQSSVHGTEIAPNLNSPQSMPGFGTFGGGGGGMGGGGGGALKTLPGAQAAPEVAAAEPMGLPAPEAATLPSIEPTTGLPLPAVTPAKDTVALGDVPTLGTDFSVTGGSTVAGAGGTTGGTLQFGMAIQDSEAKLQDRAKIPEVNRQLGDSGQWDDQLKRSDRVGSDRDVRLATELSESDSKAKKEAPAPVATPAPPLVAQNWGMTSSDADGLVRSTPGAAATSETFAGGYALRKPAEKGLLTLNRDDSVATQKYAGRAQITDHFYDSEAVPVEGREAAQQNLYSLGVTGYYRLKESEMGRKLDGVTSGVESAARPQTDSYGWFEPGGADANGPHGGPPAAAPNITLQGLTTITGKKLALAKVPQRTLSDTRAPEQDFAKKAATPLPPPPTAQPEVQTRENAFSTFSLNVSDVSFKLAGASLEKGVMPEPAIDSQRGVHQRL